MTTTEPPHAPDRTTALALQELLPDLVAFTLDVKQAHWAATVPALLTFHALTDQIAANARKYADRGAARAMALGLAADTQLGTGAAGADDPPPRHTTDHATMVDLIDLIDEVTGTAWPFTFDLERADPDAHDLIVGLLEGLEKYRYLLWAQLDGRQPPS